MSLNVRSNSRLTTVAAAVMLDWLPTAAVADCGNDGAGFASWLDRFKARAVAAGISRSTVESALADVSYDRTVVRLVRSQKSFKLSFEEFYARRVGSALIKRGQDLMRAHRVTLDRVEKRFGVPAPVLIAIWGLET